MASRRARAGLGWERTIRIASSAPADSGFPPQPDGFEGFVLLLKQPLASDPPVLDREHERASRDHLDPLAPADVGGVRNHDLGANLREAVVLDLDVLEGRPERIPEDLALGATAIDTLQRSSRTRPVNFSSGAERGQPRRQVAPVPGFVKAPDSVDVLPRHRPTQYPRREAKKWPRPVDPGGSQGTRAGPGRGRGQSVHPSRSQRTKSQRGRGVGDLDSRRPQQPRHRRDPLAKELRGDQPTGELEESLGGS